MFKLIKNILKKIIPASWHHIDYRIRVVLERIDTLDKHIIDNVGKKISNVEKKASDVDERISNVGKQISDVDERISNVGKQISDIDEHISNVGKQISNIDERISNVDKQIEDMRKIFDNRLENIRKDFERNFTDIIKSISAEDGIVKEIRKTSIETLWGQIFNNTISQSKWLKKTEFSPGRWAAGYPFLYILFKSLNEIRPKSILELGLGQTTKMISQYALEYNASHDVIEHDETWISFFNNDFQLSKQTKLIHLELTERQFMDDDKIIAYNNFKETLYGKKFNLISIDGPFGSVGKNFSRIDILELLPDCLNDSFAIIIDDFNRNGEKNTVEEIKRILTQRGIKFANGVFRGEKEACIIVSEDFSFLSSV